MSRIMRQTKIARMAVYQRRFIATEDMLLESKHKLLQYQEKYLEAIANEDYELAARHLEQMKGWIDDINELNYDLDNNREAINKDRRSLGLSEIR